MFYFELDRAKIASQTPNNKLTSSIKLRSSHTVSQSQPGSRSTSPTSMRSLHLIPSSSRTTTNTRSRIPLGSNGGSRMSSRESSPGRTRMYIIYPFPPSLFCSFDRMS